MTVTVYADTLQPSAAIAAGPADDGHHDNGNDKDHGQGHGYGVDGNHGHGHGK